MNKTAEQTWYELPERAQRDVEECWDEETKEFDWDRYQYLCDIAEYWGMDE